MNTYNPTILTLKDAQILFSAYSPLQTNTVLKNTFLETVDTKYANTCNMDNIRKLYNSSILKYYPNEISVKASFINKVLFKTNNHVTIFELPVGNSRADLCKINGSSIAYEIKTDLDNLTRLNKQLDDYLKIFEKVFVICSINKLNSIEKQIIPSCGIYTYTISKNAIYSFQMYKNASLSQNIDTNKQLKILRKQELVNYFSLDPNLSKDNMISNILQSYPSNNINHLFKEIIKNRYRDQWLFLKNQHTNIFEIDYQWFFKNPINPQLIYN